MSNIRTKKDKNFVTVHKQIFEDPHLSFKAKGIAIYLLGKPDDWSANVKDLIKQSTDGRDAVYAGLKELEEQGYLIKKKVRNEAGHITGYDYVLYEIKTAEKPHTENPEMVAKSTPLPEKPFTGKPFPDNPPIINNNKIINNDLNKRERKANDAARLRSRFDEFKSHYPKRFQTDIPDAQAVWIEKLKPNDELCELIINSLKAQIAERELKERHGMWAPEWKGMASWLRKKRWTDAILTEHEIIAEMRALEKNKRTTAKHNEVPESALRRAQRLRRELAERNAGFGQVYDADMV